MSTPKKNEPAKKNGPVKLPSKPISFANQSKSKKGGKANTSISTTKKGGVNLMRKLSGM